MIDYNQSLPGLFIVKSAISAHRILNERCTSDIDYVNNKGEKKILTY